MLRFYVHVRITIPEPPVEPIKSLAPPPPPPLLVFPEAEG